MYETMRTHLWSLFNKLAAQNNYDPEIKPGICMPTFKPKKEEFTRLHKSTYRIAKPDIEHIENDNINVDDLTSDSSDDEASKEQMFQDIQSKSEQRAQDFKNSLIKKDPFGESGYGDEKDKFDFSKMKVTKDDKM